MLALYGSAQRLEIERRSRVSISALTRKVQLCGCGTYRCSHVYKQMCPVLDFFRRRLLRSAGLDRADAPFAAADLDFTATSFGAGSAALGAAALSSDSDDSSS